MSHPQLDPGVPAPDLSTTDLSAAPSDQLVDPGLGIADDNAATTPVGLGQDVLLGDTGTPGAADSAALLLAYIDSSKPVSINLMPDTSAAGTAVGAPSVAATPSDIALNFAGAMPAAYGGGDAVSADDGGIALFSKSAGGGSKPGGGGGGGGGTLTPFSETKNGITFNVNWDSSVANAPQGFTAGVAKAVDTLLSSLASASTRPITITINAGYGEVMGSNLPFGVLGESTFGVASVPYSSIFGDLQAQAGEQQYVPNSNPQTVTPEYQAFNSLPADGSPVLPATNYLVNRADEKVLGIIGSDNALDGAVGFAKSSRLVPWNFSTNPTTSGQYDFVSVAEHEISEVMGRVAWVGQSVQDGSTNYANSYSNLDLFRYASFDATSGIGTRSTASGGTAYLSTDGGKDVQSYYNTNPSAGDLGDWSGATLSTDAFNYAGGLGPAQLTQADINEMNVLGYRLA